MTKNCATVLKNRLTLANWPNYPALTFSPTISGITYQVCCFLPRQGEFQNRQVSHQQEFESYQLRKYTIHAQSMVYGTQDMSYRRQYSAGHKLVATLVKNEREESCNAVYKCLRWEQLSFKTCLPVTPTSLQRFVGVILYLNVYVKLL